MSDFLKLNLKDLIKGVIVAALTTVLTIVLGTLEQGSLTFDWKAIGLAALTAGLAYLTKNLFTNSDGKIGK